MKFVSCDDDQCSEERPSGVVDVRGHGATTNQDAAVTIEPRPFFERQDPQNRQFCTTTQLTDRCPTNFEMLAALPSPEIAGIEPEAFLQPNPAAVTAATAQPASLQQHEQRQQQQQELRQRQRQHLFQPPPSTTPSVDAGPLTRFEPPTLQPPPNTMQAPSRQRRAQQMSFHQPTQTADFGCIEWRGSPPLFTTCTATAAGVWPPPVVAAPAQQQKQQQLLARSATGTSEAVAMKPMATPMSPTIQYGQSPPQADIAGTGVRKEVGSALPQQLPGNRTVAQRLQPVPGNDQLVPNIDRSAPPQLPQPLLSQPHCSSIQQWQQFSQHEATTQYKSGQNDLGTRAAHPPSMISTAPEPPNDKSSVASIRSFTSLPSTTLMGLGSISQSFMMATNTRDHGSANYGSGGAHPGAGDLLQRPSHFQQHQLSLSLMNAKQQALERQQQVQLDVLREQQQMYALQQQAQMMIQPSPLMPADKTTFQPFCPGFIQPSWAIRAGITASPEVALLQMRGSDNDKVGQSKKKRGRPKNSGKKKKKKKRDPLKPKRPLSAYNIFFHESRVRMLSELQQGYSSGNTCDERHQTVDASTTTESTEATTTMENPAPTDPKLLEQKQQLRGRIGFQKMAKIIGAQWQELDRKSRIAYNDKAEQDMRRYRTEMEVYNANLRQCKQAGEGQEENEKEGDDDDDDEEEEEKKEEE